MIKDQVHSFACRHPVFPGPFVEKSPFYHSMALEPLSKSFNYIWRGLLWGFWSSHCYLYFFPWAKIQYFDCFSFVVNFEIRKYKSLALPFKNYLSYLGPQWHPTPVLLPGDLNLGWRGLYPLFARKFRALNSILIWILSSLTTYQVLSTL